MSNAKKLLALLLVTLFAVSLIACNSDSSESSTDTTTTAAAADQTSITTVAGETTTTVGETTKTKATKTTAKTTAKTTKKSSKKKADPTTQALIARTTNKAGNASASFVKSLKGFTLKCMYPWTYIQGAKKCEKYYTEAKKAVEKEYGVTIEEKGVFSQYNEQLATQLAAKKCDYHIYYASNGNFASYFQKDYVSDLTSAMRESGVDFKDPWYTSGSKGMLNVNGKQYAWIPSEDEVSTPFMLVYNKTLLSRKKLTDPYTLAKQGKWTWAKLKEYAKKFDNDKSVTGLTISTLNATSLVELIAHYNGTSIVKISKGSQPTTNISDAKVKSALTEFQDWAVGKKAWLTIFYKNDWTYAKAQLRDGKVAMMIATQDDIQGLKEAKDNSIFGVAPVPSKSASKTYIGISVPSSIPFIPIVHQKIASKILFVRNEYYRYCYRYADRLMRYRWESYLGDSEAIDHAIDIKYGRNGNKVEISWISLCEDPDANVTTSDVVAAVYKGTSTPAQAISSKKTALAKAYKDVWSGCKITGNV